MSILPRRAGDDAERELLIEVARLYAALAQVLRTGDVNALHADLTDLLSNPPATPPRRTHMKYAKAFVGAGIAGLTALGTALVGGLTAVEGVGVALATLIAFAGVWVVPNKPQT